MLIRSVQGSRRRGATIDRLMIYSRGEKREGSVHRVVLSQQMKIHLIMSIIYRLAGWNDREDDEEQKRFNGRIINYDKELKIPLNTSFRKYRVFEIKSEPTLIEFGDPFQRVFYWPPLHLQCNYFITRLWNVGQGSSCTRGSYRLLLHVRRQYCHQ